MAQMMSEDGENNETDKINVVPLADLSLVLLIILMVLSPMVMSSMIRVSSPSLRKVKATKTQSKSSDPLLVKVTPTAVFLNNNPVDSDQFLAEQIAIKLSRDSDRPVIVSAEDAVQVGRVVFYLDLCKQHGASNISLLKSGAGT